MQMQVAIMSNASRSMSVAKTKDIDDVKSTTCMQRAPQTPKYIKRYPIVLEPSKLMSTAAAFWWKRQMFSTQPIAGGSCITVPAQTSNWTRCLKPHHTRLSVNGPVEAKTSSCRVMTQIVQQGRHREQNCGINKVFMLGSGKVRSGTDSRASFRSEEERGEVRVSHDHPRRAIDP
jgi:hypothetical protein